MIPVCRFCGDAWTHVRFFGAVAYFGHYCFEKKAWVYWHRNNWRVEDG